MMNTLHCFNFGFRCQTFWVHFPSFKTNLESMSLSRLESIHQTRNQTHNGGFFIYQQRPRSTSASASASAPEAVSCSTNCRPNMAPRNDARPYWQFLRTGLFSGEKTRSLVFEVETSGGNFFHLSSDLWAASGSSRDPGDLDKAYS